MTPVPTDDVDERAINFATAEFRRATETQVGQPGGVAAITAVRTRLRHRAALLAALVVLLLAGAVGGVVLTWRQQLPAWLGDAAAPHPTSPSPGASSPAALNRLDRVTLDVPVWSPRDGADACPSGMVTFAGGHYGTPGNPRQAPLEIVSVRPVDVTGHGEPAQVAVVRCDVGETGPQQVAAYQPLATGAYSLLGQVTRTDADVKDILAVSTGSAGTIEVTVGDIRLCCAQPAARQLTQRRSYSWTGSAFRQSAGPTTFLADSSRSRVRFTVQPLTYGPLTPAPTAPATSIPSGGTAPTGSPSAAGARGGVLRIRINNDGPETADLTVLVVLTMARADGGAWSQCTPAGTATGAGTVATCSVKLTAGSLVTLELPVLWPAEPVVAADGGIVQVRTGDQKYGEQPIVVTGG